MPPHELIPRYDRVTPHTPGLTARLTEEMKMTIRERAIEWLQDHSVRSSDETCLLPQEWYDRLADRPDLAAAVDEFIDDFRTVDRGETAYARIHIVDVDES